MAIIVATRRSYYKSALGLSWAQLRGAVAGAVDNGASTTVQLNTGLNPGEWQLLSRVLLYYDASALLPQQVLSGRITVQLTSKSNGIALTNTQAGIALCKSNILSAAVNTNKYYISNIDTTLMSDNVYNYNDIAGVMNFELNAAGIANINNNGGIGAFAILFNTDRSNTQPAWPAPGAITNVVLNALPNIELTIELYTPNTSQVHVSAGIGGGITRRVLRNRYIKSSDII